MNSPLSTLPARYTPLPHRVALALVCMTFPLIWVGGLVTTYDAGMAVPDWPTTYSHGMFSYPWQRWLSGPWDIFVEHGHRQLGAVVGLLTICLVVAVWWKDNRPTVRWLSVVCLLAVIGQGVLGGVRVLRDDPRLAMVHGCTGPLFFCLTIAMAALTSRWWYEGALPELGGEKPTRRSLTPLTWIVFGMACGQLILGAQLRHAPANNRPETFQWMVIFHLLMAGLLLFHIVLLATRVLRTYRAERLLRRPAWVLLGQISTQLLLGLGTWVVKYNWPAWLRDFAFASATTVKAGAISQAIVVTAHVAIGSLLLVTSLLLAMRITRFEFLARGNAPVQRTALPWGVAL